MRPDYQGAVLSTIPTIAVANRQDDIREAYQRLNQTRAVLPEYASVLTLFQEQVRTRPDAEAVVFGGRTLSYRDLDRESDAFARRLLEAGANQAHPVVVCLERSEQISVVLWGVLKSGSYYVPLDPTHPRERMLAIAEECKPAAIVVSEKTAAIFEDAQHQLLQLPLQPAAEPTGEQGALPGPADLDAMAYMIYTSGTTGKPKGVLVPHRGLLNLMLAMRKEPGIGPGDRLLGLATISFDMSVVDMFLPMVSGATLVMSPDDAGKYAARLVSLLEENKITFLQATPVSWRMLLHAGFQPPEGMRMIIGGEAIPRDLANALIRPRAELWNFYGPTETTVWSSMVRMRAGDEPVRIGPPLANTTFYVADEEGRLLPPGKEGELYIGGAGVARGYFQRPELTAQKFIRNPWFEGSGERLFRTGDLVRLLEDGSALDFYGRLDHQVKLRGYRIELQEIEAVLRSHTAIADCAVVLREDEPGEPWLVAYITTEAGASPPAEQALLQYAAQKLPTYMLPSRVLPLAALPQTSSRKVDRRALTALPLPAESAGLEQQSDGAMPADDLEAELLRIFRSVLRRPGFGVEDNFFEYGGYSLLSLRLFARIEAALHKSFPITILFEAPTVRQLAEVMRRGDNLSPLVTIRKGGEKAPLFLVHSYLLYELMNHVVEAPRPIYGLREREGERCDPDAWAQQYAAEIDAAYPTGLVHLGGWCAAAPLTLEVARYLQSKGREVGVVALFDALAPGFEPSGPPRTHWLAHVRRVILLHLEDFRQMSWQQRRWRLRHLRHRLSAVGGRFFAALRKRSDFLQTIASRMAYTPAEETVAFQLEHMHLEPIDLRVQLFKPKASIGYGPDAALGWGSIALGGVDIYNVPGDHESMFLEPHIRALRDSFQSVMRRIEDSGNDSENSLAS